MARNEFSNSKNRDIEDLRKIGWFIESNVVQKWIMWALRWSGIMGLTLG